MRIGVDIDGVLADFNTPFIERVIAVTGEDKFPPRPFEIPVWSYPEHYGYTSDQTSAVWESITADKHFWEFLPAYSDTPMVLTNLFDRQQHHDDVYFITSRPGVNAKRQTENWLIETCLFKGYWTPTVLISSQKGFAARALNLDLYVDDRRENCHDVHFESKATRVFIYDQPWNREGFDPYTRVTSVREVLSRA